MKKKEQINIHKNLQGGKTFVSQSKNTAGQLLSHKAIAQKGNQKGQKKILSQQKVNIQKASQSKNSNKQSRPMTSSLAKNQKSRSKQKVQSVKGSKKSIRRQHSQDENSVTSARRRNIYTNIHEQGEGKFKKVKKYAERSSQSERNEQDQQNSIGSITESIKSESQRLDVENLVDQLDQKQFQNLYQLKIRMIDFIFKNRIVRDQQYNQLFQLMAQKFPQKQDISHRWTIDGLKLPTMDHKPQEYMKHLQQKKKQTIEGLKTCFNFDEKIHVNRHGLYSASQQRF